MIARPQRPGRHGDGADDKLHPVFPSVTSRLGQVVGVLLFHLEDVFDDAAGGGVVVGKEGETVEAMIKEDLVAERVAILTSLTVSSLNSFENFRLESSFATIRLRTVKTRNCVSAKSGLSLVHQLAMSAWKRWRRLRGFGQRPDVVSDVRFIDGIDERKIGRKAA